MSPSELTSLIFARGEGPVIVEVSTTNGVALKMRVKLFLITPELPSSASKDNLNLLPSKKAKCSPEYSNTRELSLISFFYFK